MKKSDKTNIEPESTNKRDEDMKVEWLGVDGGLILLYFVLAGLYTYGILNRIDIIVGIMAPAIAFGITALIFLRYCFEVFSFSKKSNKTKEDN